MRWGGAVTAAVLGLALHRETAMLADPSSCPGLGELIGATTLRVLPSLSAGGFVSWTNAAATAVALVAFYFLVHRSTRSFAAAMATTLAVATLPMFQNTLGLSGAAVFAVTAFAFSATSQIGAVLALSALSALAPALTVPAALAAGWLIWSRDPAAPGRRAVNAALAMLAPAASVAIVLWLMPHVPLVGAVDAVGCVMPAHINASPAAMFAGVSRLIAGIGPLAFGLAVLGAFASRDMLRSAAPWFALLLSLVPIAVAGAGDGATDTTHVLIPAVVGFWWLVAAGVNELRGGLALLLLAAALPILEITHHPEAGHALADRPYGQETLSRNGFARFISETPTAAVIVIDDALTDLLDRSLQMATPSGAVRRVVSAAPADVRIALRSARVFAFSRAALALQHQGYAIDDAVPGVMGLSELRQAGACTAVTSTWRSMGELTKASQIALVAGRPGARGPIVAYLTGLDANAAAPRDWTARDVRGFDQHTFDLSREEDRRTLREDIAGDGAPASDPIFLSPIVTRLEIWRVPDAPSILTVSLGRRPTAAIAYNRTIGDRDDVSLCPSFDHPVARLEMPIK